MEYRHGIHEENFYIYLWNPGNTANMKTLAGYDKRASEDIEMLQKKIEMIKAYRIELAERAKQIACMTHHIEIELKREHRLGGIQYFLRTNSVFEDGTSEMIECTRYEGKQRAEAIKEFKKLQKDHPHFQFVLDIAVSEWEKRHR